MSSLMMNNGFFAEINMPPAPEGDGVHKLPPYDKQKVHVVDLYKDCPSNWMHGSSKASSYFLVLRPGRHLWIDLNANFKHTHNIAIVLSIQGINPITGQQTKELRLEKYEENCPIHNIKLGHGRYCDKCGYQLPAQNYISTVSTPHGFLWIDGFRAENGIIRGFLITEDTVRGVANQLIGEDRVFAIGIAFYLSKEPKPAPIGRSFLRSSGPGMSSVSGASNSKIFSNEVFGASSMSLTTCSMKPNNDCQDSIELTSGGIEQLSRGISRNVKKLEIAAGAKINQEFYRDPQSLDFYQDEPAGIIYVNYCTEEDCDRILASGPKDLTKGGEGFLAGLKVGN